MTHSAPPWRAHVPGGLALAAMLLVSPPLRAQSSGDGFLFRRPQGSLSIWLGYERPFVDSPIFRFVTDTFTLSKSSFGAFAIGGDLSFRVAPRMELMFSGGWAGSRAQSQYRNGQAAFQTTTLERVPLTASLKLYVAPPGESVGHFAWVPSRVAPFVGAGGGLMWYRFQQYGDFIDYADSSVQPDQLSSDRWTGELHAFAGLDVALGSRYLLTGRAQYTWARSRLGSDFVGPNSVDLSGLSVTAGLGVRF